MTYAGSVSNQTHVICDRCGTEGNQASGRYQTRIITGWGHLDWEIEGENNTTLIAEASWDLCPDCARKVNVMLKVLMATQDSPDLVEIDLDALP
jgi:hypothetical protein